MKGKLVNVVGSQYPSHHLGRWCIQHYYRRCAHLGCQQSTELTPTGRFKWTRTFRTKDEIWFLRVCHHISTGLYHKKNYAAVEIKNAVRFQIINFFCAFTCSSQGFHTLCDGSQTCTPGNLIFHYKNVHFFLYTFTSTIPVSDNHKPLNL